MSSPPVKRPLGLRMLLRLLPRAYREAWTEEVLRAHVDRAGGAARARGFRFWMQVSLDVIATSIELRMDRVRDRGVPTLRGVGAGLTYSIWMAARSLARVPGFTIAVVLTLALGLGANATIFTVLDRLLLSAPAHVREPDELRRISVFGVSPFSGEKRYNASMSYPDYRALLAIGGFSTVAGYAPRELTLGKGGESERISTEWVTASYFPLLGVKPAAGRFYTEQEDRLDGGTPVAVLSWGFWQRRFGGEPMIGQTLVLGKGSYTVVGIAPRGFTGVDLASVDVWLPLHVAGAAEMGREWENAATMFWFAGIVRLNPAVAEAATMAEVTAKYRARRAQERRNDPNAIVAASSIIAARGPDPSGEARVAQLLGLIALLVLLIACANTGNLFLARGLQRRHTLAVQRALGAGRGGLLLSLIGESVLLSGAAGIFAFVIAELISPALFRTLLPSSAIPEVGGLRVLAFTTVMAALTVVLAGLIPALRATRVAPIEALRAARVSLGSSWLRRGLVAAQAALSVILLVGAALFLKSLTNASRIALGVDLDPIVLDLELNDGTRWGAELARAAYPALERARAHPAVASATITNLAPFQGLWGISVDLPGPDSIPDNPRGPFYYSGDRDYFRTLGIPVVLGRALAAADESASAPQVVVVSRAMARELWQTEAAALGQCLLITSIRKDPPCTTVVGIAGDVMPEVGATQPNMAYYLPTKHPGTRLDGGQVVIARLKPGAEAQLPSLLAAVRSASPEIRLATASTIGDGIANQLRAWKLGATLLTVFGVLALIVACAGLYSVLAFDVAQRRFELGLRAALGAASPALVRALLASVLPMVGAGLLLGLLAAGLLARATTELLFRVEPLDPWSYVAALAVLAAGALIAAAIPAWRATHIDPRVAMASE